MLVAELWMCWPTTAAKLKSFEAKVLIWLSPFARLDCASQDAFRQKFSSLLLATCFLFGTGALSTRAQQLSIDTSATNLTSARAQLAASGFQLMTEGALPGLRRDDPQVAEIALTAGGTYSFLAACAGDCDRVELSLSDPSGVVLHSSPDQSNMVVVFGVPQVSGPHKISIAVPGCKADACDASVAILERRAVQHEPAALAVIASPPVPAVDTALTIPAPSPAAKNLPRAPAVDDAAPPVPGLSAEEQKLISELASLSVTVIQAIRAKEKAKSMTAVTAPVQTDAQDATGKPKGYQEPRADPPPVASAAPQPRSQPATQRAAGSGVNCAALKQQLLSIGPGYGSYERASSIAAQMNSQCPGYW